MKEFYPRSRNNGHFFTAEVSDGRPLKNGGIVNSQQEDNFATIVWSPKEKKKKRRRKKDLKLSARGVGRNEGIKIQPEKATGVF